MTISLLNAIKNIKQDPHWIKKIVILAVIVFIVPFVLGLIEGIVEGFTEKNVAISLFTFVVTLIVSLYSTGFLFSSGNKYINSENNIMAELGEKNLILLGLKQICSVILYAIMLVIPFTIIAFAFVFLCSLLVKFCLSGAGVNNVVMSIALAIVATVVYVIMFLFILQFVNAAFCSFCKTLKAKSLLNIAKHFKILKENQHASWTLIGKEILYTLLFTVVAVALCITIVGILLIPFVCVYAYLVSMNLIAQYGKEIQIERYFE